jgi:hypothetical protein
VEVRGTKYIPLEKLTSIALEIGRRDLTNRVMTSFTPVRIEADLTREVNPLSRIMFALPG